MFGLFEKPAAPTIEPIGVAQADACAALHGACFPYAWPAEEIEALLLAPSGSAHGAIGAKGALQGFVLTRIAADEAEVLTIAVATRHRGRGIGRRLMEANIDALALRRVRSLFLEVEADNAAALALYKRLGFVPVGERKSYYRKADGGTALAHIMRRPVA